MKTSDRINKFNNQLKTKLNENNINWAPANNLEQMKDQIKRLLKESKSKITWEELDGDNTHTLEDFNRKLHELFKKGFNDEWKEV